MSVRELKIVVRKASDYAILPPEIAAAVRELVRQEFQRLRRDEVFNRLRAMKSKVADMERQLTTE